MPDVASTPTAPTGAVARRVLVLWWSQSGQLRSVAEAFCAPFTAAGHEVAFVELQPVAPYPFPWKVHTFFGEFPETTCLRPKPIAPVVVPPGEWDLVVLTSQVWFLSPSQPFAAFLLGPDAALLDGKPVVTLVSCRNMWVRGWRRMVKLITAAGGTVTDRVVATHSGSVFASYFSTLAWMLTGRRDAIKLLPAAGLAAETFEHLSGFGAIAAARLADPAHVPGAPLLADQVTASVSPPHAFGEQLVGPLFPVLGAAIGAISRPGSLLRNVCAVGMLAFILSCVFSLLIPCVVTERLLRPWMRPWLNRLSSLPVA